MKGDIHIGGVIRNGSLGYGFRVSFLSVDDARRYKKEIKVFLRGYGFAVTSSKGFHDE
jgi:hypothetical protein